MKKAPKVDMLVFVPENKPSTKGALTMNNTMVSQNTVLRQCLSTLPTKYLACPLYNYGKTKLSTEALIKIFIAAQLDGWESYGDFEEKLRAYPDLCNSINLKSISGSQLSRRINELSTEVVQDLFIKVVGQLEELTNRMNGLPCGIGRLKIVDATHIKLPEVISDWAYVTKGWTVVKMHTRLVVASPDTVYPDKIVPSTGNVSDQEGSDFLIELTEATYVMDRGYLDFKRMNSWIENQIKFVIRLKEKTQVEILEEYEISRDSSIQMDAKVIIGSSRKVEQPIRLVEFLDEEGLLYRIATTRWDLDAKQIAEIYKHRWIIELFFKWIKQSLRVVKLWSTKPQGIWNQMFLALIAYALTLIVKLSTKTKRTAKQLLRIIRTYAHRAWEELLAELAHKKTKTSRGRPKIPETLRTNHIIFGSVALVKEQKRKK